MIFVGWWTSFFGPLPCKYYLDYLFFAQKPGVDQFGPVLDQLQWVMFSAEYQRKVPVGPMDQFFFY